MEYMSKLILGIGLPGSGKSTALKPFAEKYGYAYISPDEIRAEVSGDASIQTDMRQVWDIVHERTAQALEDSKKVVVDATFVKGWERRAFIQFARDHGAKWVQGVFAAVPLEITNERNNDRDRAVPDYAMERMNDFLSDEIPAVEDGFDSVFDINEFQELERAELLMDEGVWVKEFKTKLK
jgi:predicted kinase